VALKYGSKGAQVRTLQSDLVKLGFPLPKWGVDGDLGLETWNALRGFALSRGTTLADGDPGRAVPIPLVAAIRAAVAALPAPALPPKFFDVTNDHSGKQRRGARAWQVIDGIVLHQTAALLGPNLKRWHDVAAHIGIPRDGKIILMNPLDQLIWHANSFNATTVGIEISGNFEGIDGDPSTLWAPGGGPHRATAAQIQAARDAVGWICAAIAAQGGNVRFLYAHRQSSTDRRADPGSRVWENVGLWGQQTLGLSAGKAGYKVGTGRPIPREWDPSSTAAY
jgi:hypothetical protein